MPADEWIRTFADGRKVKFSHDEVTGATFITAQIEGNEVVYSILLNKAETKLSRAEVEGRFERELSKK
jgi:Ethanolamine utilization protein EutJ (predicted chaperonin)